MSEPLILDANFWHNKEALIVDDYLSLRKSMRELIQVLGLTCREAENGLSALEEFKKNPPDLVITDLVMPEMDGFELIEAIKTTPQWRTTPIVVISTHSDSRYIFKALRLGADDYLTKPATKDMLTLVLNRLFDHG